VKFFSPGVCLKKDEIRLLALIAVVVMALPACSTQKILKHPEPVNVSQPIAAASDDHLDASVNWVIVRNGPGMWVENADWDEYLITVSNQSNADIEMTNLVVVDSLGIRHDSLSGRKDLVRESKKTIKHYKESGLDVKAGWSGTTLVGAGLATGAIGAATIPVGMNVSSGAVLAGTGVVIAVPALIGVGVYRGVHNSKLSSEIKTRRTELPVKIEREKAMLLDLFYPFAPSPLRLEVYYVLDGNDRTLVIDTTQSLMGLHLGSDEERPGEEEQTSPKRHKKR